MNIDWDALISEIDGIIPNSGSEKKWVMVHLTFRNPEGETHHVTGLGTLLGDASMECMRKARLETPHSKDLEDSLKVPDGLGNPLIRLDYSPVTGEEDVGYTWGCACWWGAIEGGPDVEAEFYSSFPSGWKKDEVQYIPRLAERDDGSFGYKHPHE